jgi:hypothetical protein
VLINELSSRGPNGGDDEFIELRNDSSVTAQIGGWRIMRSRRDGTTDLIHTLAPGISLGPGCHYLLGGSGFIHYGPPVDTRYSLLMDDEGGIALLDSGGSIVDQVGMSTSSAYREGAPLDPLRQDPDTRHTYARTSRDTNDNRSDFSLQNGGTPQSTSASCSIR